MDNLRIAVILGGNRRGRTGPAVSRWFVDRARKYPDPSVAFDFLDVEDISPQDGHGGPMAPEPAHTVEAADGYVVLTPEYNHGYPGELKSAIDAARREWFGKAVGFVSYGGMSGGLRAIEQLRSVFSELHTATIRDTVSLHNAQTMFGPDGTPVVDMSSAEAAVERMLRQLAWWALALREARERRPYPG
ncbi:MULTISPECIES: NADPH-dependent FMN reductase [Nocardiopsis]|uniref:NADPH-dependent FMN reductase n=1 Tax=Nocardiopsis dassonvillei (strain ATCC 23218 / DSM 43111 / CIP 107115 / JCM 7437 / KCTC 9190 / NBRC 14626 / NCTC 10488 / NRRL B-5397 / IMRU 509) TaxID=446468 RepID=D7B0H9_NOCDD|nr:MULTISPECIES: NAD(P)H-dependent oxidoreductase [Nocardiopsis]ADH66386.1 NADPH-dependent FMN reductase [Nocardiopsis dassonvillei subsp. dassonvillei DSM 43111]APC34704.1 NADPH-dependent FMN reductase [Nocardiopsis dassonvillei]NKY81724.1 NAD(P)H-dependent oxidoreductase [Nocardiopsis dassonvillei]VEI92407.1 NADPH azoreductase [Nocardiopsis dassonvillei]